MSVAEDFDPAERHLHVVEEPIDFVHDDGALVENEEMSIAGQADVERMVRHLGYLQRDIDKAQEHRDQAVKDFAAEADSWLKKLTDRKKNAAEHIRYQVQSWYLEQLDANPKAPKTLELISGELKAKPPTDVVAVDDEDALIDWDLSHAFLTGQSVCRYPAPKPVAPAVDKVTIKRLVKAGVLIAGEDANGNTVLFDKASGEQVPGVVIEHRSRWVDIKPGWVR